MRQIVLVSLFLGGVFGAADVHAADTSVYDAMVQKYTDALQRNDQPAIAADWKQINATPGAKEYMEAKHPWAASAFRLTGMSLSLGETLDKYQKENPPVPEEDRIIPEPQELPPLPPATPPLTNKDTTAAHPNQDQPTNTDRAIQSPNKVNQPNSAQALQYPNQDEPSNQELIRRRLEGNPER